jgi:hypothetical protein
MAQCIDKNNSQKYSKTFIRSQLILTVGSGGKLAEPDLIKVQGSKPTHKRQLTQIFERQHASTELTFKVYFNEIQTISSIQVLIHNIHRKERCIKNYKKMMNSQLKWRQFRFSDSRLCCVISCCIKPIKKPVRTTLDE